MRNTKFIFLFLFTIISIYGVSQNKISEINFDRIKYKKIREYLHSQQSRNIQSLVDIKPSMSSNSDNKGYRVDERVYIVKDSVEKVWQHYKYTNPGEAWNGTRVKFGMLFSRKKNKVIYQGEDISSLEPGQVVYLNLKLLRGLSNLATVFEFISIDDEKKVVEFSYVDGNITEGKQQLRFTQTSKGYTQILHTTYYKGKSAVRDYLYPYFHTRLVNEFHRNMKRLYKTRRYEPMYEKQNVTKSFLVAEEKDFQKEKGDL